MTPAAALAPRKAPAQRRSRQTYEILVEAAARVLESGGAAGFNTNAVAARAGVSVGSLYQYFPHKTALVAELSRRGAAALMAALDDAAALATGESLEADVRALARAAIGWQVRRPALARVLDQMEEGLDLDSGPRGTAAALRARIAGLLAPYRPHQAASALDETADDCLALARALIDRAAERGEIDIRLLEGRLVAALCGYLAAED